MSENLIKGVLLEGDQTGTFDYDCLANRPYSYVISVSYNEPNLSDTNNYVKYAAVLKHNGEEIGWNTIKEKVEDSKSETICEVSGRMLPLINISVNNGKTLGFIFQRIIGQTFYQVTIKEDSSVLSYGKFAFNNAKEEAALYCYFVNNKLYKDKDCTQELTRKELQTFVTNNNNDYIKQVYCYWPTYKPGNQGRYLRLNHCGGSEAVAKFSGLYYNEATGQYDFKTVLFDKDNVAQGIEKSFNLDELNTNLPKLINEVYGVTNGIIPIDGVSRLDRLEENNFVCYYVGEKGLANAPNPDAATKFYTFKELIDFARQRKQMICYCATRDTEEKKGDHRILYLSSYWTNDEYTDGRIVFSSGAYDTTNNHVVYLVTVSANEKVVMGSTSAAAKKKDVVAIINELYNVSDGEVPDDGISKLDRLETNSGKVAWVYESFLSAVQDISERTLGSKASYNAPNAEAKVYYNDQGKLTVSLLKDISLGERVHLHRPIDLVLNGHQITTSSDFYILGRNIRFFGGTGFGEEDISLGVSNRPELYVGTTKRGKILSTSSYIVRAIGSKFECYDVDFVLNPSASIATATAILTINQADKADEMLLKNCNIDVDCSVSYTNLICAIRIQGAPNRIKIQGCNINLSLGEGSASGYWAGILAQGRECEINNCQFSAEVKSYGQCIQISDCPNPEDAATNLPTKAFLFDVGLKVSGPGNGISSANYTGQSFIQDIKTEVDEAYYEMVFKSKEAYVDGGQFSQCSFIVNEDTTTHFSNCLFPKQVLIDKGSDIDHAGTVKIGANCNPVFDPASKNPTIVYTGELYRKLGDQKKCQGKDYNVLYDYFNQSILSQLSTIVDGGI